MVEKENFDRTGIVFVNYPRTNIDHVFSCKGRPGSDATVRSREDREENANVNEGLAMGGNGLVFQSGEIVAGS